MSEAAFNENYRGKHMVANKINHDRILIIDECEPLMSEDLHKVLETLNQTDDMIIIENKESKEVRQLLVDMDYNALEERMLLLIGANNQLPPLLLNNYELDFKCSMSNNNESWQSMQKGKLTKRQRRK